MSGRHTFQAGEDAYKHEIGTDLEFCQCMGCRYEHWRDCGCGQTLCGVCQRCEQHCDGTVPVFNPAALPS